MKQPTPEVARRLPPGQHLTEKWPVLTYGKTPRVGVASWTLRCFGLVEEEKAWRWEDFLALPRAQVVCDIHCVTRWSRLDVRWEGVRVREILAQVRVKPEASAVMVHAHPDYTTNVLLEDLLVEDALLAIEADGQELKPDHGGPCRLVIPHLYFWKSAKWVRGFELMDANAPGFWEVNGYHLRADPWQEERYSDQETNAMQRIRAEAARKLRERR
ncbi:MAG: sulfite oxidase-like oxidoreductase [Candidatus Methylomirabilia bacterium]